MDNTNVIALTLRVTEHSVFAALVAELKHERSILEDEIVASRNFEYLGMVLDGPSGCLRHTSRRCWRLWSALTKGVGLFPQALSVLEEIFPWSPQASLTHNLHIELAPTPRRAVGPLQVACLSVGNWRTLSLEGTLAVPPGVHQDARRPSEPSEEQSELAPNFMRLLRGSASDDRIVGAERTESPWSKRQYLRCRLQSWWRLIVAGA